MSIERTSEYLADQRATRVGFAISASVVATDEAVLSGGDLLIAQIHERMRATVRAEAMGELGIAADVEVALRDLRAEIERMLLASGTLHPGERFVLDGAFNRAAAVIGK